LIYSSPSSFNINITSPRNTTYGTLYLWLNWTSNTTISWCHYELNDNVRNNTICKLQNRLNDTSTSKNLTFVRPGSQLVWVDIPRNSTVGLPQLILHGYKLRGEWKITDSPTANVLYDVDFLNETFGFMVGFSGTILFWNGTEWRIMNSPTTANLRDVSIYNATLAFAVGSYGKILKWNGTDWNLDTSPLSTSLYSVDFASGNLAFAGDQDGRIIKWNGTWYNETTPIDTSSGWDFSGISLVNETFGFGVVGSYILKWNGTHWYIFQDQPGATFERIDMYNTTLGFITEAQSLTSTGVLKWNGTHWGDEGVNGTYVLYGIDIINASFAYVVGDGGKLLKWNGTDWNEKWSPTTLTIYCVSGFNETVFAGGNSGLLLENGGFPRNPKIDVANSDLPWEWSYTGNLNSSTSPQVAELNNTLINEWLSSCSNDVCTLPINISVDSIGILEISNVSIVYMQNVTFQASTGKNVITIWAKDKYNNEETKSVIFTVDLVKPTVSYCSVIPKVVINGTNVTLSVSANDNRDVDSVWASIRLPNSTVQNISLINNDNVNYSTTLVGRYNVTCFANDTVGNVANITTYFLATQPTLFNVSVITYNGSLVSTNLTIYFPNTTEKIDESSFNGILSRNFPSYIFDLEFTFFDGALTVRLNGVNITKFRNNTLGVDRLTVQGFLVTYVINNTYTILNASLRISYNDSSYTNENYLGVYTCHNWNFTNRSCVDSWKSLSATQNKTLDLFEFNVSSLSAFSIKQEEYCGDGIKNNDEFCDGNDFGGLTCQSFGFNAGSLSCTEDCMIDASGCYSVGGDGGETTEGGGGGGGSIGSVITRERKKVNETCVYNVSCTEWSGCSPSGTRMRICFNLGNCPEKYFIETEPCVYQELPEEFCGDGICQENENCSSCPMDCGECKKRFPLKKLIWFAVVLLLVPIIYLLFRPLLMKRSITEQIEALEREKAVLLRLMKSAQIDYFQRRVISRETYELRINSLQRRIEEINEKLRSLKEIT